MKKILLALVAVAFLATSVFAAEPKESFTIDSGTGKKPGVIFPHKKHSADFGIKCSECHHKQKAESDTPRSCFVCHQDPQVEVDGETAPVPGTKKKDVIFHKVCLTCHKKVNKEEGKKAPKGCKGCHKK